MSIAIVIIYI